VSCHILTNAIERNLNVVISAPLGMGVVTSTLEELGKGRWSVVNLNGFSQLADLTATINQQTEVIVFDSLQQTDYDLKTAAAELMQSRTLGGLKLPNLKSVIGFFGRITDETDDLAESYASLGPSLAMDWR